MSMIEFLLNVKKTPSWNRMPYISEEHLDILINQAYMLEMMQKQRLAVCLCDDSIMRNAIKYKDTST